MKTTLLFTSALALCVIALVACAAPTPTSTTIPPTSTPAPASNLNPTISAIRTETAATAQAKISAVTQEMSGLGVGTKAPDFTLMDATGRPVSLAEEVAKHKSVVLVFYRGEW